jgi:hypothetical protein
MGHIPQMVTITHGNHPLIYHPTHPLALQPPGVVLSYITAGQGW